MKSSMVTQPDVPDVQSPFGTEGPTPSRSSLSNCLEAQPAPTPHPFPPQNQTFLDPAIPAPLAEPVR